MLLQVRGVVKDFGGLRALDKVDLDVEPGEIFGLIGPNGSGKTTLLNVITGFLPLTAGSIMYEGKRIFGLNPFEVAARGVVRTFQITSIFPNLTVEEGIVAASFLKTNSSLWGSFFQTRGYRRQEARLRQRALEILSLLEMENKAQVVAGSLGLGEQRKTEIAIALAAEPRFLLLDEPACGLNPAEATELVYLLRSLRDRGLTILIVEHNMKVVMELCSRIAVFDYGIKIAEGSPAEVANNEQVIAVYLGGKRQVA